MPTQSCDTTALLLRFIDTSKDGYGVFDANDKLIFSNYVFRDIFCLEDICTDGCNFADLVHHAFTQKRGLNIEANDIDDWLSYVGTVRRKSEFRLFEVDLVDGRWMLFSEHLLDSGELLVHTKDITRQKVTESRLKRSNEKLHHLALTDELTQLANRRSFVESVESELARCQRSEGFVTMVVMDLDYFKNINDQYGHHGGDEVLVHVAKSLKQALRQYDIVGRIGGEEFAIFLGQTDAVTSLEVAERVRALIAQTPLHYEGREIYLTASLGMTCRPCDVGFEQLYAEADEALYMAKGRGRNRVDVYPSEQTHELIA
ncbi:diguanylate cyclase [Aestuariibacter halophilus]|uniref:diguanylate cyclase n=1 Tax=Fluctibacter halophilus TaxID=226011 RepID=A0ABS8GAW8_9ALTE|nr:sensor domain-containing diguanylate cyclase [Aestuariibacter halophilus]MCC2617682.1 diguanylate cyclase [Aestuariibacter halophilus]